MGKQRRQLDAVLAPVFEEQSAITLPMVLALLGPRLWKLHLPRKKIRVTTGISLKDTLLLSEDLYPPLTVTSKAFKDARKAIAVVALQLDRQLCLFQSHCTVYTVVIQETIPWLNSVSLTVLTCKFGAAAQLPENHPHGVHRSRCVAMATGTSSGITVPRFDSWLHRLFTICLNYNF